MKEISELVIPDDLRYSEDHEWVRLEGENLRVGISDYAQDQLGDVVFVELPEVGAAFEKGQAFGTVESVKAVSELYMPFGGEIVEINNALEDSPELVNESPYGEGWMIAVKPNNAGEVDALLASEAYTELLKGLD